MNNNDIIIRLRYALDIKDTEMIQIFSYGSETVTREQLSKILTKQNPEDQLPFDAFCSNHLLESFLNGLISFKRGVQNGPDGKPVQPSYMIKNHGNVNNVVLKKVKIALKLTSDDMLDVLRLAGVYASESELSAILRKEGHRNYKPCGDRYARNFLKGLTIKYRESFQ